MLDSAQGATVEYLLPVGAPVVRQDYRALVAHNRPLRRIGMLANGFPGAPVFLQRLEAALSELLHDVTFRIEVKGKLDYISRGIQEPLLMDLSADCDAIIIAWGHCGSCTSGTARDGIAFAAQGIPSVQLICDVFWKLSEWVGPALGMDNLPRVEIPHPVSGTSDEFQNALARRIAPQILAKLRGEP